ncbi:MAG: glycosyltransferase family 4 protein [Deltaproteobacteria bacterium]|nr:glycosyltransferase family 4 protein [Deltaproteobacteria bacterium]
MRILMVSDDYLPNPGGIAAHVYELTRQLVLMGHEVDLVVGHNRVNGDRSIPALPNGARVIRNRPFSWNPLGYLSTTISTAYRLWKLVRERKYDVCHWHNLAWESWGVRFGAAALARVFTNHSSGFPRRMQVPWRRRLQLPFLLSFADQVVAPSKAREVDSVAVGYPAERVRCIPNGVDVDVFTPGSPDPALMRRYGIEPLEKVLVVPARLEKVKGVDVLIRALPRIVCEVPDVRVIVLGDGSERSSLVRLARAMGVRERIVFAGNQSREDMPTHLRLGLVAVLPSRTEGLPLACLEAMATGLPVVASRVGGLPDVIEDSVTGRLVPSESDESLAQAISRLLLKKEDTIREKGLDARQVVSARFSWRALAGQTVSVYESALLSRFARRLSEVAR